MKNLREPRESLIGRLQEAVEASTEIVFTAAERKHIIGLWADACEYRMEFYIEFIGTDLVVGECDPRNAGNSYVVLKDRVIETSHHSTEGSHYGNLPWRVFQPIIATAAEKIKARAFMLRGPQKWNNNGTIECHAGDFLQQLLATKSE